MPTPTEKLWELIEEYDQKQISDDLRTTNIFPGSPSVYDIGYYVAERDQLLEYRIRRLLRISRLKDSVDALYK